MVPNIKEKDDVMNCELYRGVKEMGQAMTIVERVLKKKRREIVNLDNLQFEFIYKREMFDALFVIKT